MTSIFMVNGSTPIRDAYPDYDAPPVLDSGELTGQVKPHRSRPRLVRFGRQTITACGLAWWWQLFPGGIGQVSTSALVTIYDPERGWVSGSGILSAPVISGTIGPSLYSDFQMSISGFDSGSEVSASIISETRVYEAGIYVEYL